VTRPEEAIIDDFFHWKRWPSMLSEVSAGEELDLPRLRRIVCESASTPDTERYGEEWLGSFISYCERGGIGRLRLRADGSYALKLADPLPSVEEAFARVEAAWPVS
jgi:hypothetical protein